MALDPQSFKRSGFTFAAYGQLLAVHGTTGTALPVTAALTSLGYSGEHFDAKAQQQYLRARWYNPANGRFNRLDPFTGNMKDPQSLHKYTYVHSDPVQGVDPTGWIVEPYEPGDQLNPSGKGVRARHQFSIWVSLRYGYDLDKVGKTLGTILPAHFGNGQIGHDLKPDLVDTTEHRYYELKPVTHERKASRQLADYETQLSFYDRHMPPHNFYRGYSANIVPYKLGGRLMGYVIADGATYKMLGWPEQRDLLSESRKPGRGLLYYELREENRRNPTIVPSIVSERPLFFEHRNYNETDHYLVRREFQELAEQIEATTAARIAAIVALAAGAAAGRSLIGGIGARMSISISLRFA